ncbi:Anaphase promoting complex subunit 7 [Desmophyllum pertusum]|uniref:Anaphase promoting complex subunit 7 n=1 Tax=Desmophyllum pertusum TaxID=174260 RepID=A0A9X0CV79_9CNID|nr:Anaphase promoting complex subunit 7 [Desmophyllum pertusum]
MAAMLDQVKALHEAGLFSSSKMLASFLLSMTEHGNQDKYELSNMVNKYQLLVYLADSLFDDEQYKRAEQFYTRAIQLKKIIIKHKPKTGPPLGLLSEIEVKYKMSQCYVHLKEYREATAILEGISQKQRSLKINMSLAKLYQRQGMERSAISCYKEVLRVCPLALEAVIGLLSLGVPGSEVTSLTSSSTSGMDWLGSWIKGQVLAASGKHAKGAQALKTLETQCLRDNVELLCNTAEMFYNAGDYNNAKSFFQRAHSLDPCVLQGMDTYAFLLSQGGCGNGEGLEKLAKNLIQVTQLKPEPWIAMGHFCNATSRKPRAVYFAQKAHTIDSRNVQALVLKASLLQALEKQQESLLHFREAVKLAPWNFEAQKGLVECYMSAKRHKEALTVAKNAHKTLGANPRTLTLCASVMAHEPSSYDKATSMLEKSLAQDETYTDAVCLLAEIMGKKQEYDKAIALLRKHMSHDRTPRLHQLLGDYLALTSDYQEALDHYTQALSMNPGDSKAMEGIQNVERANGGEVDHDSGDEADEPNGGVSLEEEDIEDEEPWAPQDIRGALF